MNCRKLTCALAALALATLVLLGCSGSGSVSLAIHPWIGYEPLYLARDFGWLPARVHLLEGSSAGDSLAALQAGTADAAALTLDEMLAARVDGIPLTAIAVFDVSSGADRVIARDGIEEPAHLAGRRIAVEQSALGGLMLAKTLEAGGLSPGDLRVLDIAPDEQLAAWRAGRIDAAVTYEPTASLLVQEGGRSVFDSRRTPNAVFDVLAVRRDRLDGREGTLAGLVAAHFRALEHLRVNRQDAVYRVARHQGVGPEEVRRALAGVRLPGLAGNRSYLAPGSPLEVSASSLNRLMVRTGLLPRRDSLEGLSDARFLPAP